MDTQFKHKEPLLPPLAWFATATEEEVKQASDDYAKDTPRCCAQLHNGNTLTQCDNAADGYLGGTPLCDKHFMEHRQNERDAANNEMY